MNNMANSKNESQKCTNAVGHWFCPTDYSSVWLYRISERCWTKAIRKTAKNVCWRKITFPTISVKCSSSKGCCICQNRGTTNSGVIFGWGSCQLLNKLYTILTIMEIITNKLKKVLNASALVFQNGIGTFQYNKGKIMAKKDATPKFQKACPTVHDLHKKRETELNPMIVERFFF